LIFSWRSCYFSASSFCFFYWSLSVLIKRRRSSKIFLSSSNFSFSTLRSSYLFLKLMLPESSSNIVVRSFGFLQEISVTPPWNIRKFLVLVFISYSNSFSRYSLLWRATLLKHYLEDPCLSTCRENIKVIPS